MSARPYPSLTPANGGRPYNRPASHDDLPEYDRQPVRVLTRPECPTPAQAEWYGNALAAAPAAGLLVTDGMHIDRPRTEYELDQALASMQRQYDQGREQWVAYRADGTLPTFMWALVAYCKAEGLPVPEPEPEK